MNPRSRVLVMVSMGLVFVAITKIIVSSAGHHAALAAGLQPPRLPDLPDVDCGLTFGAGGGAAGAGFAPAFLSCGRSLPRLDEKSGMPRGDLRFMSEV